MSDEKVISKKAADLIGDYGDARQEVSADFGLCPDDELYHEEALKALKNYVGDLEAMVERLIEVCAIILEDIDTYGTRMRWTHVRAIKGITAEWRAIQVERAGGDAVDHYNIVRAGGDCELCRGTGEVNGEAQGGER